MSVKVPSTPDFLPLGPNEHAKEQHQSWCLQAKHFIDFPFDLKEEGEKRSGLTVSFKFKCEFICAAVQK